MTGVATRTGRIGPNAVTRIAEAAEILRGRSAGRRAFTKAGLAHHWRHPPDRMVPDDDVARLHRALRHVFGPAAAAAIGAEAGRRTADYLLGHRIPRLFQTLLRMLPKRASVWLLLLAISRHAWTFAGQGRFSWRSIAGGFELTIANGPVSRLIEADGPVCHYYAATFQALFRSIGGETIRVVETGCEAAGAPACVFVVSLSSRGDQTASE